VSDYPSFCDIGEVNKDIGGAWLVAAAVYYWVGKGDETVLRGMVEVAL